ncbi:hypothetical protein MRX96_020191 [Rhipicephalus microplus]
MHATSCAKRKRPIKSVTQKSRPILRVLVSSSSCSAYAAGAAVSGRRAPAVVGFSSSLRRRVFGRPRYVTAVSLASPASRPPSLGKKKSAAACVLPGRNKVILRKKCTGSAASSAVDQSTTAPCGSGLARQSPLITRNSAPFEEGGVFARSWRRLSPVPSVRCRWRFRKETRTAVTLSKPLPLRLVPFNVSRCILALLHNSIRQTSPLFSLSPSLWNADCITDVPPARPLWLFLICSFLRPWPRIFACTDRPPSSALGWLFALSVFYNESFHGGRSFSADGPTAFEVTVAAWRSV